MKPSSNRAKSFRLSFALSVTPAMRGVARGMHELRFRDGRVIQLFGGAMSINFGVK